MPQNIAPPKGIAWGQDSFSGGRHSTNFLSGLITVILHCLPSGHAIQPASLPDPDGPALPPEWDSSGGFTVAGAGFIVAGVLLVFYRSSNPPNK